jgi:uncharacterized protein YecT (DUF1311 family)
MMLLALLLAAAPAPDCNAANTQTDMNICESNRAKRADAALNAKWKALVAQNAGTKAAFLASQRLWLQFRAAECKARGARYAGGTMQPMVVSGCYADLTEARTKDIDMIVQDRH